MVVLVTKSDWAGIGGVERDGLVYSVSCLCFLVDASHGDICSRIGIALVEVARDLEWYQETAPNLVNDPFSRHSMRNTAVTSGYILLGRAA